MPKGSKYLNPVRCVLSKRGKYLKRFLDCMPVAVSEGETATVIVVENDF